MIKVVFECNENMNHFKEEFEFDDDVTDKIIEEAFVDWVWEHIGDNFVWYRKDEVNSNCK